MVCKLTTFLFWTMLLVSFFGCTDGIIIENFSQGNDSVSDLHMEYVDACTSRIEIFAAGTPGNGIYPIMDLRINGRVVARFADVRGDAALRKFVRFSYQHPTQVSSNQIQVAFVNDHYVSNDNDRNLRVDRIRLDGVDYQSEHASTFSTGTWAQADKCAAGHKKSEWLNCSGYFQYASHGSYIKIFAAGKPAYGVYPTMELRIDGKTVKTYTNVKGDPSSRGFQTFTYSHPTPLTPEQVQVAFVNDVYGDGGKQDRNLMVDKITLNGVAYQSESWLTHSTGTWDQSNACAPGYKKSEWLHCSGRFRYASSGSNIKIYAAGIPANGVYPTMELRIDGNTVKTFNDVRGDPKARVFKTFSKAFRQRVVPEQIEIAFVNDIYADGGKINRDLRVDKIELDGKVYQAESPLTYSTGTWTSDNA